MSLILQIVNNVHRTRIISQRASWAIPTSSNMTATGVAMKPCRKALNVLRAEFLYTGGALGSPDLCRGANSDQRHGRRAQPIYRPGSVLVRSTEKTEGHTMTSGSLHDTQLLEIDGTQDERLARRVAELYESDPQFRAAAPLPEVIEAACAPDLRLTQIFETIVEGYADS